MGRVSKADSSSGTNSEIDIHLRSMDKHSKEANTERRREDVYCGDTSDLDGKQNHCKPQPGNQVPSPGLLRPKRCAICKGPNEFFRYCGTCWRARYEWVPKYVRTKYRPREKPDTMQLGDTPSIDTWSQHSSTDIRTFLHRHSHMTQLSKSSPGRDSADSGVASSILQESDELTTASISCSGSQEPALGTASPPCKPTCAVPPASFSPVSLPITQNDSEHVSPDDFKLLCIVCCRNPKNAVLVHGKTGHVVCCYPCGRTLWKKIPDCPVCKRRIDKVVKIY